MSGNQPATTEMTCEEVEELLPLIADKVLEPEDDPAVFEHIARCPDCQRSLATHDLVSLALEQTPKTASAPQPEKTAEVIQFRLPWAAAAAWFVLAGGSVSAWFYGSTTPATATVADNATVAPQIEVLDVRHEESGPAKVLLRVGDAVVETTTNDAINQQDLPADAREDKPAHVPVGLRRR